VGMFQVARITYIYWLIECTPKPWFVSMFKLIKITYIYWPIECTPKLSFCGNVLCCKNYIHLLANIVHSNTFICQHV
jgi:hypothetical protein